MLSDKEFFVLVGQEPTEWLKAAEELKAAADIMYHQASSWTEVGDRYLPTLALLSGYALEVALKGVAIRQDPKKYVTPDGLKHIATHDLNQLAGEVGLYKKLSEQERDLLRRLTEYTEWASRYPIPLIPKKFASTYIGNVEYQIVDALFASLMEMIRE